MYIDSIQNHLISERLARQFIIMDQDKLLEELRNYEPPDIFPKREDQFNESGELSPFGFIFITFLITFFVCLSYQKICRNYSSAPSELKEDD